MCESHGGGDVVWSAGRCRMRASHRELNGKAQPALGKVLSYRQLAITMPDTSPGEVALHDAAHVCRSLHSLDVSAMCHGLTLAWGVREAFYLRRSHARAALWKLAIMDLIP